MNGWLICARGKSFAVYAATPWERKEWMHHTEKCIKDQLAKSGSDRSPVDTSEIAPVWVPDSDARTCMQCRKVQFSFIERRVSSSSPDSTWNESCIIFGQFFFLLLLLLSKVRILTLGLSKRIRSGLWGI